VRVKSRDVGDRPTKDGVTVNERTDAYDPSWEPVDVAALATAAALPAPGGHKPPPSMRLAVVTCMDARIRPSLLLGLDAGTMHVMRNAGGRVTPDVLRSLLLSTWTLGTRQVAVIHHSGCGTANPDPLLGAALVAAGATGPFPPLLGSDQPAVSLRADVAQLRSDPSLPADLIVTGHRYDLDTGRLVPLAELEARG
jgi:carbonic anhydrase